MKTIKVFLAFLSILISDITLAVGDIDRSLESRRDRAHWLSKFSGFVGNYVYLDNDGIQRNALLTIEQNPVSRKHQIVLRYYAGGSSPYSLLHAELPLESFSNESPADWSLGTYAETRSVDYLVEENQLTVSTTTVNSRNKSTEHRTFAIEDNVLTVKVVRDIFKRRFGFFGSWVLDTSSWISGKNTIDRSMEFFRTSPSPMSSRAFFQLGTELGGQDYFEVSAETPYETLVRVLGEDRANLFIQAARDHGQVSLPQELREGLEGPTVVKIEDYLKRQVETTHQCARSISPQDNGDRI